MIRATFVGLVSVAAVGFLVNVAYPGKPPAPPGSTREAKRPLATSGANSGAGATSYSETILHAFTGANGDGNGPTGGLIADSLGNYYGATAGGGTAGLGTIYRLAAGTSAYAVFHNFSGVSGFELPAGELAIDANGSLYGTMEEFSEGEVFKLTSAGTEGLLYTFLGPTQDGYEPDGGLVLDGAGDIYGSAGGGTNNEGTVFKLIPKPVAGCANGTHSGNGYCESVLHNFPAANTDGKDPNPGLVLDKAGNLYGTTLIGGTGSCSSGCGTVFKIDTLGNETVLYSFTGTSNQDGNAPNGGLVLDAAGDIFGTTAYGGSTVGAFCGNTLGGVAAQGCGILFELSPVPAGGCASGSIAGNGYCEKAFYRFQGPLLDGYQPSAGLILDGASNLYGTTGLGGVADAGTVFKLDPGGNETVLYNFTNANGDGSTPVSRLAMDGAGNIYGTTPALQSSDGFVFRLAPLPATAISLSVTPSDVGQAINGTVQLTATVSPVSGSGTPTGAIDFFNNTTLIATVALSNGVATFSYNTVHLALGEDLITATYAGDSSFGGSISPEQLLVVSAPLATTTTLQLAPASVTTGSSGPVAMTATVAPTSGSGTPTGSITFFNGAGQIGSAALSSGTATLNYNPSSLAIAAYSITASYSGDDLFLPSTSSKQTLTVTAAPAPAYTASVSPTSLTISAGKSGQATFTVTPQNGFNSQVSFSCSGLPSEASCGFQPPSVTPSGGIAATSTLTITTTAPSVTAPTGTPGSQRFAFALLLFAVPFVVIAAAPRRVRTIALLLALVTVAAGFVSCGGGSSGGGGGGGGNTNPGTPLGTTTVTVATSTAGAGNQNTNLMVTITQ